MVNVTASSAVPRAGARRGGAGSEVERDPAEERSRRPRREVDVVDAPGRLAAQAGGEGELRFSPVDIGQVLDGQEDLEVPVAVARGRVDEGVAAGGLVPELVRPAIAEVAHLEARRQAPRQPRREIGPR